MKYTPRLPVSEVNVTPRSALKEFVLLNITELSFSRGQETAADEFGLDVLQCAYGHAAGATDFFRKIPVSQDPRPLRALLCIAPGKPAPDFPSRGVDRAEKL